MDTPATVTYTSSHTPSLHDSLPISFCDIDDFKAINDAHGHDAGDRVLKVIADTLAQISNDNCHVARHGGEEFVMLFRGLTPAEAAQRLNDARERLADSSEERRVGNACGSTFRSRWAPYH